VTITTGTARLLASTAVAIAILASGCGSGPDRAAVRHGRSTTSQPAARSSDVPSVSAPEGVTKHARAQDPPSSASTTSAPQGVATGAPAAEEPDAPPGAAISPGEPAPSGSAAAAAGSQTVRAYGVRLSVPTDWPVYDVASDPARCVRADRHAVYLGNAGPSPSCPSVIVGRTETVQIEPLDARTRTGATFATTSSTINGVRVQLDPAVDTTHAVVAVLPDDGVVVTITFATDRGDADQILRSLARDASTPAVGGGGVESTGDVTCAALGCPNNPGLVYTGLGFDACSAPSTSQMSAWLASPFRSIGVYIGGANRGCSQPNLTSSWVATVLTQGWKLVPIYVGLQAPCATFSAAKIDPANAAAQGAAAATDAISRAAALSIGVQRPIYLDMEAYDNTNASCVTAVRAFVSGWAGQLHQGSYLAGFYSSAASGIADQSAIATNPAYDHLDAIWFAHWNNDPSLIEPTKAWLPDDLWTDHQRMHQYQGGHNETYGGVTINIDRDSVDAQVVG
jgi:hypothetical protein